MKLFGEHTLSASRQQVWDLFNDPSRLAHLIPGCENLQEIGPDQYSGKIVVGVAAIKGEYSGKISLQEKHPPEHYRMVIDGKGKQGFVRGSGTIDLSAAGADQTLVKYSGDVQLGGPLMQVGQRMVDSAAKLMMAQFFTAAEAELKAQSAGGQASQGFFINLFRLLLSRIRSLFR